MNRNPGAITPFDRPLGSVFVLDDEKWEAEHLARLLSSAVPCHVTALDEPQSLLESRPDNPCDLLVTDLRMPRRDGLAVLAEIKALVPLCDVIIITRFATLEAAVEAMRLGAMDFLQRDNGDLWIDSLIRSIRHILLARPSRRAPGLHRENLIHFFLERTSLRKGPKIPLRGEFEPGLALEYAVKLLLDSCQGVETKWHRRRTATEEHDLICLNQARHRFWRNQGPIVIVECKDRSSRSGSLERSRFEEKIRNRKGQATIGIYVSCAGFTRNFGNMSSPTPVPGGPLPVVVPIDGKDLTDWALAVDRLAWLTDRALAAVC